MKKSYVSILAVVLLTVVVRLYHITAPIADWHSFRQADTASVARLFARDGIDFMHPRYHDVSNIQSGKDNPQGWRMVEFPLYQVLAVAGYSMISSVSIEMWLRIVTIASAAGTAWLLILLGETYITSLSGVFAGIVYALLPYSVFYGRVTLAEPLAVFLALASLFCLTRIQKKQKTLHREGWFIAGAVCAALSVLVKPTAAFVLLPAVYILYAQYGLSRGLLLRYAMFGVISLAPFLGWRAWIAQFPEGIPASEWLLNKDGIRFKGAWFYWLFSQRIASLILGYWGVVPFALGLMLPQDKKEGGFLRLLLIGGLLYLAIFAGGNVQHDYYQIILLPAVSLYVGKGLAYMVRGKAFSRLMAVSVAIVCVGFTLAFSWYTMRTYYWINRPEIIEAGKTADRILPKDAKVIAPYNGDTTFLYQTKRQGWPLGFDIDEKIAMGATAYVTVSPTDDDWETMTLAQTYTVLVRNDRFAIIDLTKPKSP